MVPEEVVLLFQRLGLVELLAQEAMELELQPLPLALQAQVELRGAGPAGAG